MRFFIKAYAMHEDEADAVREEARGGGVEADRIHEGLIEGIADAEAIRRLAEKGVVVQAIAEVPEKTGGAAAGVGPAAPPVPPPGMPGVAPLGRAITGNGRPHAVPEPARAAGPEYWLADLISGLTDKVLGELDAAGAEIIERDPSGSFVVRTTRGEEKLQSLPSISALRRYGQRETLEGAASLLQDSPERSARSEGGGAGVRPSRRPAATGAAPRKGRFEAICHRAEDAREVAQAIERLGARVSSLSGRVIKFVATDRQVEAVADLPAVASVAAKRDARLMTDLALPLIGFSGQAGSPPRFPFDGEGEIVGVADTGLDSRHPDFDARIVDAVGLGRPGVSSDPDGHGTHVAGTIAGDGSASRKPGENGPGPLRGVAPAARIYFQSVLDINGGLGGLPDDLRDLFEPAYQAGVRVHNNSWGAYLQSRYDTMALDVDQFVYDHPDFLPVIAAGNEGSCLPGMGSDRGFVDYPSLGAPATAKNGLTVGASRSSRKGGGMSLMRWVDAWPDDFGDDPIAGQTISGNDAGLAAFSSRGPCDDMRIKPDVVAPGTDIAATKSIDAPLSNFWGAYPNNRDYAFMGGTSMACPIASGCAVLVRQYFRQQMHIDEPSAALIKAAIINGTQRLAADDAIAGPAGEPNYHQGFGRIDMASTIPDPADPGFELYVADSWKRNAHLRFTARSGRRRWAIDMKAPGALRITLAWTDPPGRALQNQLRLILDTRVGGQPQNWVGNEHAAAPLKVPSHDPRLLLPGMANVLTRDPHNNVQVIRVDAVKGAYTLALFADSLLKLPQDFALVISCPAGSADIRED